VRNILNKKPNIKKVKMPVAKAPKGSKVEAEMPTGRKKAKKV